MAQNFMLGSNTPIFNSADIRINPADSRRFGSRPALERKPGKGRIYYPLFSIADCFGFWLGRLECLGSPQRQAAAR